MPSPGLSYRTPAIAKPGPDTSNPAACRDAAHDPSAVLFSDALAGALADPVRAVASAAAGALTQLAEQHDVKPALLRALHAGESRGRLEAALTLAKLEPPSLRLLPALAEGLALQHIRPLQPIVGDPDDLGSGRHGVWPDLVSLADAIERVKKFLSLERLQFVGRPDQMIQQVAVACGTTTPTLRKYLKLWGIKPRPTGRRPLACA